MEEMIDPRDTRRWVCEWAENAYRIVSATFGPDVPRIAVQAVTPYSFQCGRYSITAISTSPPATWAVSPTALPSRAAARGET